MLGMISLAILLRGQKPSQFKNYENAQISVKFLREISTGYGILHLGNDLSPYLVEQAFEPAKPILGETEGSDPLPKSFTLSKPEKGSWKFTTPSRSSAIAIEADSQVVIPYHQLEYDGFTVLDVKSGAKLWSRKARAKENRTTLTLEGGVLFQWEGGHLTATQERTGEIIWDRPIEARSQKVALTPILVKANRLFLNLEIAGKVVTLCFDAKSGAEIWRRESGFPISIVDQHNLPGLALAGTRIVGFQFAKERSDVDLQLQSVFCLNAVTGEQVWKCDTAYTGWPFTPEVNESSVFAGSVRRPSFLYRMSDGTQSAKLDLRWGHLIGPYIVDVDDHDGLVIYASSNGERLGRIQLSNHLWQMQFVKDRLTMGHFAEESSQRTVIYEVLPSK